MQALVLLGVLAAVALTVAFNTSSHNRAETRRAFVDAQAAELAVLHKALMRYREDKGDNLRSTWGAAAHALPTLGTLASTGQPHYLPDQFTHRAGSDNRTPWLQTYQALGALLAGDGGGTDPVWVVYASGAMSAGLLSKTGVDDGSPEAIAGLKRDIVTVAARKYGVPAAYVEANSSLATGAMGAWTKDLGADFKGNFPTSGEGRAVVLVGYPDLEGEVPSEKGPKWTNVRLVLATGGWGRSAREYPCNAMAGEQEIVAWPVCSSVYNDPFISYGSDVGTITFDRVDVKKQVTLFDGFRDDGCIDNIFGVECHFTTKSYTNTSSFNDIYLNGFRLGRDTSACKTHGYYQGRHWPTRYSPCQFGTPNEDPPIKPCVRVGVTTGYTDGSGTLMPAANINDRLCGVPVAP